MATAIEILNTIRDNSSAAYARLVPAVTKGNFAQVGQAITSDSNIMNEFIKGLINKVALSHIKSKLFNNPLAKLKSQGVPMGNTIEEIFINPAEDMGFQKDGTYLLKNYTPDAKVAYYAMNRQSTYPASIFLTDLKKGLRSINDFNSFYGKIVTSLYSGDNIDEFMLCKKMIGLAADNNHCMIVPCDLAQPKEVSKLITTMSKNFAFPKVDFAPYNIVNAEKIAAEKGTKCNTFCERKNQVLLMANDTDTEIGYEVLATMFHTEPAAIEAMTILIDDFPSEKYDIYAVLCDKESIQMRDVILQTESKFIESNLSWNIWLHHFQHQYISMFGNFVVFAKEKATP